MGTSHLGEVMEVGTDGMRWTSSRSSLQLELMAWALGGSEGPGHLLGLWPEQQEEWECLKRPGGKTGALYCTC